MCNKCKAEQNSVPEQKWMDRKLPSTMHFVGDLVGNRFINVQPNGLGFYPLHGVLGIMNARAKTSDQISIIDLLMASNNAMGEINHELGIMKTRALSGSAWDEAMGHIASLNETVAMHVSTLARSFLEPIKENQPSNPHRNGMGHEQRFGRYGNHPAFITKKDIRTVNIVHTKAGAFDMDVLRGAIHQKLGIFEFLIDNALWQGTYPAGVLRVDLERPHPLARYEVKFITPGPQQQCLQVAKQYPQHFDVTITHQGGRINFSAIEEYVAAGSVNREDLPEKIVVTNTSSSNDYAPGFYNVVLNYMPAPFGSNTTWPVNYVVGGVIKLAGNCTAVNNGFVVDLSQPPAPKADAVADQIKMSTLLKGFENLLLTVEYDNRHASGSPLNIGLVAASVDIQFGITNIPNLRMIDKIPYEGIEGSSVIFPDEILILALIRGARDSDVWFVDSITSSRGKVMVPHQKPEASIPVRGDLRTELNIDQRTGNWVAFIKHPGGRVNWLQLKPAMERLAKKNLGLSVPPPWANSEYPAGHYTVAMHLADSTRVMGTTFITDGGELTVVSMVQQSAVIDNIAAIILNPIEEPHAVGVELNFGKMTMPDVAEDGTYKSEGHWAEGFEVVKVKQTWSPVDPQTHLIKVKIMVEGEGKLDLTTLLGADVFVAESLRNKKFYNGPAKLSGFYQKKGDHNGYLIMGVEQMQSSSLELTDTQAATAWEGFHAFMDEVAQRDRRA